MHKTQDITSGDYLKPKSLAPGKIPNAITNIGTVSMKKH